MADAQAQIKEQLFDYEFSEDLAERIYRSMRFERENDTPDWQKGGNAHAQNEARACAAGVIEMVRQNLRAVEL